MKLNRRGFLGAVATVPFALKLNLNKVEEKKKKLKPLTTLHPSYTGHIPEGWHTVQVVDVYERPSRLDGSTNYGMNLRTADGKEIHSIFSSKYLQSIVPALNACKLPLDTETVNLEDAIGKEMRVHIEEIEYNKKKFEQVTEYIALER